MVGFLDGMQLAQPTIRNTSVCEASPDVYQGIAEGSRRNKAHPSGSIHQAWMESVVVSHVVCVRKCPLLEFHMLLPHNFACYLICLPGALAGISRRNAGCGVCLLTKLSHDHRRIICLPLASTVTTRFTTSRLQSFVCFVEPHAESCTWHPSSLA